MTAVAELWQQHRSALFPGRLRSIDIAGIEMVTLDSDVAGCVSVWLENGGTIDDRRWDVLASCERRLELVVPELAGYEAVYCRRLLDLTMLILQA